MEAPEEKRTPHSDITSFLILSNNHYTRNGAKVTFSCEKIYKEPLLKELAGLMPQNVQISKPSSTYDNGICISNSAMWMTHHQKHIKSATVSAELEDVATKQVRLSLELTDH